MKTGSISVEVEPLPKLHKYVLALTEVLVNETVLPDTENVKLAVGLGAITTCFVTAFDPPGPVAVRVTLKVPAVFQIAVGFCWVELLGVPPVKDQLRPVMVPVDISVNCTVWLWQAGLGDQLKSAVGGVPPPLQADRQPLLIRPTRKLFTSLREVVLQLLVVETNGHMIKFGGQLLPFSGSWPQLKLCPISWDVIQRNCWEFEVKS